MSSFLFKCRSFYTRTAQSFKVTNKLLSQKKSTLAKHSLLGFSLSLFFTFCAANSHAQQRYLALTLVNENDRPELELIRQAKNAGCNAVLLSVQWGSIEGKLSRILKQENGVNYNVWKQYDDQIALATSLGMKIGINIAVSTGDDASSSESDRYGINTGDGWTKEDRILNANENGEEAVFQKPGGFIRPNINLQFVMTSIAAQSTITRIKSFTERAIQRYKYLQNAGNLLYVNIIYTRTGEAEFESGTTKYFFNQPLDMDNSLMDYSHSMRSAYRNWLSNKYTSVNSLNSKWGTSYSSFSQVQPKLPSQSTFTGEDGTDWFLFRTSMLKNVNTIFKDVVKGVNPDIKVISHHGSVYDKLSKGRGTFYFNEIAADLDGIKINDDTHYDHRFAMDLLRTNLPGKMYINEAAYANDIDVLLRQLRESYTHGAQVVAIMFFERIVNSSKDVATLQSFANDWIKNSQTTVPNPANSDHFKLSSMIRSNGCYTNRDYYSEDCDAYRSWRSAYDNAGGQPVNIFLQNDLISVPLPVTLVRFSAEKQESAVRLNWETSEETNSEHFEIQHSTDGKLWDEIAVTPSAGDSKTAHRYDFAHQTPSLGENLYRLKMIDKDGTFAYSKITSVIFDGSTGIVLFPNPASSGIFNLKYSGELPEIQMTDINGRTVPVLTEQSGLNQLTIKAKSQITPGLYFITSGSGSNQIKHKMVVIN